MMNFFLVEKIGVCWS